MGFEEFKDLVIIFTPIISAVLIYRQNKKSQKEMKMELENKLKEMDKETELFQKRSSWDNSMPQTNKYMDQMDIVRQGNIANLSSVIEWIMYYINKEDIMLYELENIKVMLLNIKVPLDHEEMYPYEIPIMIKYKAIIKYLDEKIKNNNGL
ncbi:MAG: hypothetical protein RSB41_03790 [Bacilli bacterium]